MAGDLARTPQVAGGRRDPLSNDGDPVWVAITGRFVLLPKHLVTGAAEASIVSPTRRASDGFPLWKVTLQARPSRGFFVARPHARDNPMQAPWPLVPLCGW
jgi:hypothetical protein